MADAGPCPPEGLVIVALPRSGTTLLQRLLDAHPDVACPPETNVLRAAARFLDEDAIAEGLRVGVVSGLGFAGFEPDEVIGRTRAFAFGFLRDFAARAGKRVWAEKTPFHVFHLEAIERLCAGHVGWICLLRHPLDVVVSFQDLLARSQTFSPELHAYIQREPNVLRAFAQAWVDGTRAMLDLAARRPESTVILRYESLVTDPAAALGALSTRFGLAPTDAAAQVARAMADRASVGFGDWKLLERTGVDTSSVGRWRGLSKHTISTLGALVNETAVAAGYEPLKRQAERTPEDARRALEVSHMVLAMQAQTAKPGP